MSVAQSVDVDLRGAGDGSSVISSEKRSGLRSSAGGLSRQSLEDSFFAVLFVMHSRGGDKKKKGFRYLDILFIVFDYLQMVAFVADTKRYNWVQFDWLNSTFQFVFAAVPRSFLETSGYVVYTAIFAAVVVITVLSILDALWVLHSFRTNQFTHLWPIKLLKFVVSLFFSSFFLSALGILFIALDCRYGEDSPPGARFHLTTYPEVPCWGVGNAIVTVISILTTVVILLFASALSLVDADTDPSATAATSSATPYESLYGTVARALLVAVSVAASSYPALLAVAAFFSGFFLAASVVFYLPFYNARVNQLRAALYGTVAWSSVIAFGLTVAPQHPRSLSLAFIVGFPVSGGVCALAAHMRQKRLCDPERLIVYNPDKGWTFRGRFHWPHEVEIATRFLQGYTAKLEKDESEGNGTEEAAAALEEALEKADGVFRAGLRRFPDSALVHLQYAGFVRAYYKDNVMETSYVDRARVLELDLMSRFFVFRKLKDREREATGAGGAAMDIVSFVEFQEKFRLAREGYRKAVKATRVFWTSLLERDESEAITKASEVCRSIDTYEQQAARNYAVLVEKYPRSIRLLRSYGAFVENVRNDPAAAEAYYRRADAEEEDQSRKRTQDDAGNGPDGSMDNSTDGVVVISALGMITSANAVTCRMFGYKKAELIGKKIECLMPAPFKDNHASYLQAHIQSGVTRIMNTAREMPALHKNGSVFPIRLLVSRVDIGSKASFVGSLHPLDNWAPMMLVLPAGRVLACNRACESLFGRTAEELAACSVKELVAPRHVQSALDLVSGDYTAAAQNRRASGAGLPRAGGALTARGDRDRRRSVASAETARGDRESVPRSLAALSSIGQHGRASSSAVKDEVTAELEGLDRDGCLFPAAVRVVREAAGAAAEVVASCVYFKPRAEARGVIIADAKGAIRGANRAACDTFGYDAKDLMGARIEDLMPPAFAQAHKRFVQRYVTAQKGAALGTKRLVECRHRLGHSFAANITLERADAGGELFFCARLSRVDAEADEKSVIITIDQRGTVQAVRGRAQERLGYHAGELVGRSVNVLMPPEVAAAHDEYLRRFLADPSKTLLVGTGPRQIKCRHRDGTPLDALLALSMSPHNEALQEEGTTLLVGRLSFSGREREPSGPLDREGALHAAASAFMAAARERERVHPAAGAGAAAGGDSFAKSEEEGPRPPVEKEEGWRPHSPTQAQAQAQRPVRNRRSSNTLHEAGRTGSVRSGSTAGQRRLQRRRRALVALSRRPSETVRRLWRNLLVSALLLFAVTVASFVASQTMVGSYAGLLNALSAASDRSVLSVLMIVESRTLTGSLEGVAVDGRPVFGDALASGARLRAYATEFLALLKSMTFGLNGFAAPTDPENLELLFGRSKLAIEALQNGAPVRYSDGLWRAGQEYAQHALILASLPNATRDALAAAYAAGERDAYVEAAEGSSSEGMTSAGVDDLRSACAARLGSCPSLFYVLRNGPAAIFEAASDTAVFRRRSMHTAQMNLIVVYSVSASVGLAVLFLAGALAFRPAFKQVRRERDQVLDLFLEIPKQVVRALARKQAALAVGSSGSSEENETDRERDLRGEPDDPTGNDHGAGLPTERPAVYPIARPGAGRLPRSHTGPASAEPLLGLRRRDAAGGDSARSGSDREAPPRTPPAALALAAAPSAAPSSVPPSAPDLGSRARAYAVGMMRRTSSLSSLFRADLPPPPPPVRQLRRRNSSLVLRRPLALSAAHGKGSEKLFRRLALQYVAASLAIAACFAAVFAVGCSVAMGLDSHTANVSGATQRRVAAARATLLAREAVLPSIAAAAGLPPDSSLRVEVPGALQKLAADLETIAEAEEQLRPSATLTPELADITYGTSCIRVAPGSCAARPGPALDFAATGGVAALVALFVEQARLLASAPEALRTYTSGAFTFLWRAGLADLLGALSGAESLYVQEARERVSRLVPIHGGLMAATVCVVVAVVALQYRPMARRLRDETRRTHHMLQLIPDEVLDRVESIREYVDKHMAELGE